MSGDMAGTAAHIKEGHMHQVELLKQSSVKPQAQDGVTDQHCTLHYNDKEYKLPILVGSDGNKLLDIQPLYA
jgi:hypothetical protein